MKCVGCINPINKPVQMRVYLKLYVLKQSDFTNLQ